jgi:hypothetical protein
MQGAAVGVGRVFACDEDGALGAGAGVNLDLVEADV